MEGKVERIKEETKDGQYGEYTTQNFTVEGVWYNGYKKIDLREGGLVEFDFSTEKWGNKIVKDTLKIVDPMPAEQTEITPDGVDTVDDLEAEAIMLEVVADWVGIKNLLEAEIGKPVTDGQFASINSCFIEYNKRT